MKELPKGKPFDMKKFRKAAKALSDAHDAEYPVLRPPEEFIWPDLVSHRGIEGRIDVLFDAVSEIYTFLNKVKKNDKSS